MLGEIPRWALERACAAIGRKISHYDRMGEGNLLRRSIAEHALLIAKHDKPPAGKLVGGLRWQNANGVMYELKQVSAKDFIDIIPGMPSATGVPLYYAVWPQPEEEQ